MTSDLTERATPERQDRWINRFPATVLGGGLRRELLLVCLGSLLVAAALTWPTLRNPTTAFTGDLSDSMLVAYIFAWNGHALKTDPLGIWDTNAFWPAHNTLAFTDSFLGYAPAGLIGDGPQAAILRYNLIYVLVAALASVGAYLLARQLGSRLPGALVAGLAFAYAPWRLAHVNHIHVLSTGGIALCLAMLARGYGYSFRHGYRPERVRPGWIIAGWLVGAWQLTIGFGVGLPFMYALLALCVFVAARWLFTGRRPTPSRPMVYSTLIGGLVFASTAALMAQPYLKVVEENPHARRGMADLAFFSPPARGFLAAPDTSWVWGETTRNLREGMTAPGEMSLLPGAVLLVLGLAGLAVSAWSVRQRVALGVTLLISGVLSLGTSFFGGSLTQVPLLALLPGWDALRTPGRMVIWVTLVLGLLAAGLMTELHEQFRRRDWVWPSRLDLDLANSRSPLLAPPRPLKRLAALALVLPAVLTGFEGLNTIKTVTVPLAPAAIARAKDPILVLPSDAWSDSQPMFWSIGGFPLVANGVGAFTPVPTNNFRLTTTSFPDERSISYLRDAGIRTVIVLPNRVAGTPWENSVNASTENLPVHREVVGSTIVFTLVY